MPPSTTAEAAATFCSYVYLPCFPSMRSSTSLPNARYISCHLLTASAGSERAIAADLYPCPSSKSPMAAFLASTSCFTLKSTRIKKASHFSCPRNGRQFIGGLGFFTCRCSLFLPGIRLGRSRGVSCYCAADVDWLYGAPKGAGAEREQASAYDAASIVVLRVNRTLCLRYWIGVRDQEGVTKAGRTNLALPAVSSLPSGTRARRLQLHSSPAASGTAH